MEQSQAIAALGALAQETRLEIYRLLVQAGKGGLAAGSIGQTLKLAAPTLSFHLGQLKHAGLITMRRESRSLVYSAEYATMNDLLGYLTENCCQGDTSGCDDGTCSPITLTTSRSNR